MHLRDSDRGCVRTLPLFVYATGWPRIYIAADRNLRSNSASAINAVIAPA